MDNDDILRQLENIETQLHNTQSDIIHLGMVVVGLLVGIFALGLGALYHFG